MNKLQDQYNGNYRGIVKMHGEKGYCKIYFPGVYPSTYESNASILPWAEPAQPLFVGGGISNGVFQYPDIGSTVWGFFEAGNINRPIFFASTNNDKNNFVAGTFIIKYKDASIIIDNKNNLTINAYSITLNADEVTINSIYKVKITSPDTLVVGALGSTAGATGVSENGTQFSKGICTAVL